MRSAPKILIYGQAGSGKSSLAILLKELLNEKGINSVITDEDISDAEAVKTHWKERIKAFDGKTLDILTIQERPKFA